MIWRFRHFFLILLRQLRKDMIMKKTFLLLICMSTLLYSCDSYTGAGAFSGAQIGSILGSAIGGISGGPRGSDLGTIVGMAGGAAVGAAVGQAADQRQASRVGDMQRRRSVERDGAPYQDRYGQTVVPGYGREYSEAPSDQESVVDSSSYGSGFDGSNSHDDRIYDFQSSDYTGNYSAQQPQTRMPQYSGVEQIAKGFTFTPSLEIRNARFIDDNEDGSIQRGELCKIIFEVYNVGKQAVMDVVPTVLETTGNKHIYISPNMHVERIDPGKGIRYTAIITSDNGLRNGAVRFCVSVVQGNRNISKVSEFNIPTSKVYAQAR